MPREPDLGDIQVLDLRTAQRLALTGNPGMAAAQSRILQARARVREAVAAWWPSLDMVAAGNQTRLSTNSWESSQLAGPGLTGSAFPLDRSSATFTSSLQATWVLFDGFLRSFEEEQARFGIRASKEARNDASRLLIQNVAQAYFNAQLARTNQRISAANTDFYQKQLEDAQNRYQVGAGAWGDVLNIRVQLNSAKTGLLLHQREYEAALYGLASLMGFSQGRFPRAIDLVVLDRNQQPDFQPGDTARLIREAQELRPDIRRLRSQIRAAEAAIGMARAAFYPRIQLNGSLNGQRLDDPAFSRDDFGNTLSINMAWNLFSGDRDQARLFQAREKQRELQLSLASLCNQVAAEVRQDLARLAAAREQVLLQRQSLDLVKENRDIAKNRYEAGEVSLVRLNEAQRDLTTTYGRLAQALVGFQQARERLLTATGRNLKIVRDNLAIR